jgi:hypothetical protein
METIIQAINKAMTKGVFNLEEASVILKSIEEVAGKLNDAEQAHNAGKAQVEPLAKVE